MLLFHYGLSKIFHIRLDKNQPQFNILMMLPVKYYQSKINTL